MSTEEIVIANALAAWKGNLERADKFFLSASVDDLQKQVAPGKNRVIYLWGHLAAVNERTITLLGLGERKHPEMDAIFLTSPDGAAEPPPADELRAWWTDVNARLTEGIAKFSASDWLTKHTAVSDEDFAKDPLRNRLAILLSRTNHLAFHFGQIVLLPK